MEQGTKLSFEGQDIYCGLDMKNNKGEKRMKGMHVNWQKASARQALKVFIFQMNNWWMSAILCEPGKSWYRTKHVIKTGFCRGWIFMVSLSRKDINRVPISAKNLLAGWNRWNYNPMLKYLWG